MCLFFFFKQKTAYEMRISDWSSDVCSSDLFGSGAISKVAEELERIGKRALVLSTPEQGASASALARELGGGAVGTFTGAAMHVPVSVVDEAASMASRLGADCTVAIGGGSTIGLAKGLSITLDLPSLVVRAHERRVGTAGALRRRDWWQHSH